MAIKNTNVNIFKFRVIVDTEQDVFRDIEIETDATFEDFHRAILDGFDFEEGEMASFYMSTEAWEKGLEIPLMEVGDVGLSMKSTKLSDMVNKPSDKVLYVYDFMRMWIFYVELVEVKKRQTKYYLSAHRIGVWRCAIARFKRNGSFRPRVFTRRIQ